MGVVLRAIGTLLLVTVFLPSLIHHAAGAEAMIPQTEAALSRLIGHTVGRETAQVIYWASSALLLGGPLLVLGVFVPALRKLGALLPEEPVSHGRPPAHSRRAGRHTCPHWRQRVANNSPQAAEEAPLRSARNCTARPRRATEEIVQPHMRLCIQLSPLHYTTSGASSSGVSSRQKKKKKKK